jgi:hypothetical protein
MEPVDPSALGGAIYEKFICGAFAGLPGSGYDIAGSDILLLFRLLAALSIGEASRCKLSKVDLLLDGEVRCAGAKISSSQGWRLD